MKKAKKECVTVEATGDRAGVKKNTGTSREASDSEVITPEACEILKSLGLAYDAGEGESGNRQPAKVPDNKVSSVGRKAKRKGPKIAYFDYDGIPAYVKGADFPVKIVNGKEVVEYDLEKFFREGGVISQAEFLRMGGTVIV